jgi:hypothetical protein
MADGERPPGEVTVAFTDRLLPAGAPVTVVDSGVRPNGAAAAAHLAAGFGCLALGLLTWLGAWNVAIDQALTLFAPVGPLSGKSTGAVLVWLLAWAGLHRLWRSRTLNFGVVLGLTLALIALGFAGTFPPFVEWSTAALVR